MEDGPDFGYSPSDDRTDDEKPCPAREGNYVCVYRDGHDPVFPHRFQHYEPVTGGDEA